MSFVKLFPILAAAPRAGPALQFLHGWLLPILLPAGAGAAAIYYLNSRPLRRQEGARFLLDLIDSAARQGRPVEQHIISLAASKDPSPGVRFHLLAAYLEKGRGLIPALEQVPGTAPAPGSGHAQGRRDAWRFPPRSARLPPVCCTTAPRSPARSSIIKSPSAWSSIHSCCSSCRSCSPASSPP